MTRRVDSVCHESGLARELGESGADSTSWFAVVGFCAFDSASQVNLEVLTLIMYH